MTDETKHKRGKRGGAGEAGVSVFGLDTSEPVRTRDLLAKAAVAVDATISEATALQTMADNAASWDAQGACDTPWDPAAMLNFVEICPHLGPNIDGYAQNIDGFGYTGIPVANWMTDLESDEAREAVREALEYERWFDLDLVTPAEQDTPEPQEATDQEIDEVIAMIGRRLRREHFRFDSWFANCCSDRSFVELRKAVRMDVESSGWGCMEMIRDSDERLRRLSYVQGYTVRPVANFDEAVEVIEPDNITILSQGREMKTWRRLRRYVQNVDGRVVFFKSPGDPRVVSLQSGKFFPTARALKAEEGPTAQPANELLFFAPHYAKSPCSPPRWAPAILNVLGTREANETNYYHLRNKMFVGGMLFVSGGSIKQDVKARLEHRLRTEMQGSKNTSRFLVVEALASRGVTGERSMLPTITFQSFRDAQTQDAMFLEYDTRAANIIGACFRQSPLMRGYTPDNLNRATAEAVLNFTETQVYQPLREAFDNVMNRVVLPELGIKFLRFQSNTPPTRSAEQVGTFVAQVAPHGGLTPAQIQRLAADVLNLPVDHVPAEWANQPLPLTLAGYQPGAGVPPAETQFAMEAKLTKLEERIARILTEELVEAGHADALRVTLRDTRAMEGEP
jgi:capsid portal protein